MNLLLVGAIGLPVASLAGYEFQPTLVFSTLSGKESRADTFNLSAGPSSISSCPKGKQPSRKKHPHLLERLGEKTL